MINKQMRACVCVCVCPARSTHGHHVFGSFANGNNTLRPYVSLSPLSLSLSRANVLLPHVMLTHTNAATTHLYVHVITAHAHAHVF